MQAKDVVHVGKGRLSTINGYDELGGKGNVSGALRKILGRLGKAAGMFPSDREDKNKGEEERSEITFVEPISRHVISFRHREFESSRGRG